VTAPFADTVRVRANRAHLDGPDRFVRRELLVLERLAGRPR
jgi:hypothetical protein